MTDFVPIFNGDVKNGKLILKEMDGFRIWMDGLEGQKVQVIVRKPRKIRSQKENKYYWGVVVEMISLETGQDKDTIHNVLKDLFLKERVILKNKEYEVIKSTAGLTTTQFEEFLVKCRQWGSVELNLYIPEPNEVELFTE